MKKTLKFCSLSSGSKGNCSLIVAGEDKYLIDAGISAHELRRRLRVVGELDAGFKGIFITHGHGDHAAYAADLSKHLFCRVYCTLSTAGVMLERLGKKPMPAYEGLDWAKFDGGLVVEALRGAHDIEGSVSFVFKYHGRKLAFAHDLGEVPACFIKAARRSNVVAIEANYDPEMLAQSDRSEELKERIAGRDGHLSNLAARDFVAAVNSDRLRAVFLLHMSMKANTWDLARDTVRNALGNEQRVIVCPQYEPSEMVEV